MDKHTTIDLNDSALRIERAGSVQFEAPGCALISGSKLLLGSDALARAYIEPHGFHNRFWHHLDQSAIPKGGKLARHHADLVYRQLEQLKGEQKLEKSNVLVVSSAYSKTQLALLLGIAQSCNLEVRGLVDAAVAAVSAAAHVGAVQFVDLDMHRALITHLEVSDVIKKRSTDVLERHGIERLSHLTIEYIADCFLDQARFDPLENAATEQLLHDHLPGWLEALESRPTVTVHIEYKRKRFEATIARNGIVSTLDPIWSFIENKLDYGLTTVLSHRCKLFPGLVEQIKGSTVAETNAVFTGVSRNIDRILQAKDKISLTVELPAGSNGPVAARDKHTAPAVDENAGPPTHVLAGSTAYPLDEHRVFLAIDGTLSTESNESVFATISRKDGYFYVTPNPEHVARLNNLTVEETVAINVGDRISTDDGDRTFLPINVKQSHGP